MAHANHKSAEYETKLVLVKPATVSLDLSEEEAKFLLDLMQLVGGYGRAKLGREIDRALKEAGVQKSPSPIADVLRDKHSTGSIYFKENV